MSLYTRQICPQRARKDIVCYKQFGHSFDNLHIITPYQRISILKPTKNNPTLMDDTGINVNKSDFTTLWDSGHGMYRPKEIRCIGRGMIHAYTYPITQPTFYFLYKCIIPKGTLYYKGINNSICAKKMLIIEELVHL